MAFVDDLPIRPLFAWEDFASCKPSRVSLACRRSGFGVCLRLNMSGLAIELRPQQAAMIAIRKVQAGGGRHCVRS